MKRRDARNAGIGTRLRPVPIHVSTRHRRSPFCFHASPLSFVAPAIRSDLELGRLRAIITSSRISLSSSDRTIYSKVNIRRPLVFNYLNSSTQPATQAINNVKCRTATPKGVRAFHRQGERAIHERMNLSCRGLSLLNQFHRSYGRAPPSPRKGRNKPL